MSLKSILSKIQEYQVYADEDTESGNPGTRASREGRKRDAQAQIANLREDYFATLLASSVFIMVNGDERDEFATIAASDVGNCFSVDPEAIYKDLANRVAPELYVNRGNCSAAFDVLTRHLEDLAIELYIDSYPQLAWKENYSRSVSTPEEFLELVKTAMVQQVGAELVGIYTARKLIDAAIARGHNAPVTPIVMTSGDDNFIAELRKALPLIARKAFVVSVGKTKGKKIPGSISIKQASEDLVQEALLKIKESI